MQEQGGITSCGTGGEDAVKDLVSWVSLVVLEEGLED